MSERTFNIRVLDTIAGCFPRGKRQFCDFTGVSSPSYQQYRHGIVPSEDRIGYLSATFGIKRDVFMSENVDYGKLREHVANFVKKSYERYEMRKGVVVGDMSDIGENISWKDCEIPYPYNLIDEICLEHVDAIMTDDLEKGLEYALSTLTEREQQVIKRRYQEYKTLGEVGKEFNVTTERVRQIEKKALRKMRHPSRLKYFKLGITGIENYDSAIKLNEAIAEKREELKQLSIYIEGLETEKSKLEEALKELGKNVSEDDLRNSMTTIEEFDFSVRTYNCLRRAGVVSLNDLIARASDEDKLIRIRNLGRKGIDEIYSKLWEIYHIDPRVNDGREE